MADIRRGFPHTEPIQGIVMIVVKLNVNTSANIDMVAPSGFQAVIILAEKMSSGIHGSTKRRIK